MNRKEIKIATIYTQTRLDKFTAESMDMIRWLKISESLARLGYSVDMIVNIKGNKIVNLSDNLRQVPYNAFNWKNYDVIKTFFEEGFKSLERTGGAKHPFIISKTTVVGNRNSPGVYFYGLNRWRLFKVLSRINRRAKYITLLSKENVKLWEEQFGKKENLLLVPTGTDQIIPKPKKNPYKKFPEKIALYAGNLCNCKQRELNLSFQSRLNNLGRQLKQKGIRLCLIGTGDVDHLEPNWVTYLGAVDHRYIWDYQYFANCGVALADGPKQNFETSKIYYYLRSGLPVVSEKPVPNNNIIIDAELGYICPYDRPKEMAQLIEKAIFRKWPQKKASNYMIKNHTWDQRVKIYDSLFEDFFK